MNTATTPMPAAQAATPAAPAPTGNPLLDGPNFRTLVRSLVYATVE